MAPEISNIDDLSLEITLLSYLLSCFVFVFEFCFVIDFKTILLPELLSTDSDFAFANFCRTGPAGSTRCEPVLNCGLFGNL
jgi:hypothetical protein